MAISVHRTDYMDNDTSLQKRENDSNQESRIMQSRKMQNMQNI